MVTTDRATSCELRRRRTAIAASILRADADYVLALKANQGRLYEATVQLFAWGKAHWVLDMSFREDYNRNRKDRSAENFAVLRHIALNLLKQERSSKLSLKGKCRKAGPRLTCKSFS